MNSYASELSAPARVHLRSPTESEAARLVEFALSRAGLQVSVS